MENFTKEQTRCTHSNDYLLCELPIDHTGPHRQGSMRWYVPLFTSSRCGAKYGTKKCVLPSRHAGFHVSEPLSSAGHELAIFATQPYTQIVGILKSDKEVIKNGCWNSYARQRLA